MRSEEENKKERECVNRAAKCLWAAVDPFFGTLLGAVRACVVWCGGVVVLSDGTVWRVVCGVEWVRCSVVMWYA